jgi:hypothetical protein
VKNVRLQWFLIKVPSAMTVPGNLLRIVCGHVTNQKTALNVAIWSTVKMAALIVKKDCHKS